MIVAYSCQVQILNCNMNLFWHHFIKVALLNMFVTNNFGENFVISMGFAFWSSVPEVSKNLFKMWINAALMCWRGFKRLAKKKVTLSIPEHWLKICLEKQIGSLFFYVFFAFSLHFGGTAHRYMQSCIHASLQPGILRERESIYKSTQQTSSKNSFKKYFHCNH